MHEITSVLACEKSVRPVRAIVPGGAGGSHGSGAGSGVQLGGRPAVPGQDRM